MSIDGPPTPETITEMEVVDEDEDAED
jgi:hypothetical protein